MNYCTVLAQQCEPRTDNTPHKNKQRACHKNADPETGRTHKAKTIGHPYKLIGFGDIHGPKPYEFIGFGAIHGPKPYEFMGFGDTRKRQELNGPGPSQVRPVWVGNDGPPA